MKSLIPQFFILHFSFFICICTLTGCFNEPEPAAKTLPAEAHIYLQERNLADLSQCVKGLKPEVLEYLNLDRNALTNVDDVVALTKLKWLRLNSNKLTALPDLKPLANLRRIYLRDNRFASVPETLKDLPALTDVDLSENPLAEVPEWLARKGGLENLSFSGTRVTRLPEDLSAWRTLKSLQLGGLSIPAEEMARIRRSLPDVAIVF